jgi:transposase
MGAGRRKFTTEFKEAAVRRLGLGPSLAEVARACEVNPNVLHRWRRELQDYGTKAFAGNGQRRADERQVAKAGAPSGPETACTPGSAYVCRRPTELLDDDRLTAAAIDPRRC